MAVPCSYIPVPHGYNWFLKKLRAMSGKGGISKVFLDSETSDMTSEGWGRCLTVTLQTCAGGNFRSCRCGEERTVERAQTVREDPIGVCRIVISFI